MCFGLQSYFVCKEFTHLIDKLIAVKVYLYNEIWQCSLEFW